VWLLLSKAKLPHTTSFADVDGAWKAVLPPDAEVGEVKRRDFAAALRDMELDAGSSWDAVRELRTKRLRFEQEAGRVDGGTIFVDD
jgi:hypothetical protein